LGPERFRHDLSPYERPTYPYRCGRALRWGKPCWQGPDIDGKCGGQTECTPTRKGDRYECRRPERGGGPCEQGPNSDGSCGLSHPACAPRPALRVWRRRFTLLAAGAVVVLIAAFSNMSGQTVSGTIAINPGALSNAHAGVSTTEGCTTCHTPHGEDTLGWLAAAFSAHDLSGQCVECHRFAGPARKAHNRIFADRKDVTDPNCANCHNEHRGANFRLTAVDDAKCADCHRASFSDFLRGHTPFAADYPYRVPNAIRYDHVSHQNKALDARSKNKFKDRSPEQCVSCHATGAPQARAGGYEATCKSCHEADIAERELVVFEQGADDALTALLLDAARNGAAGQSLLRASAATGLSTDRIGLAASAMAAKRPYTFVGDEVSPGAWSTDETSLRYRPKGHADPLLVAWFNAARGRSLSSDAAAREQGLAAFAALSDGDDGPGACGKCHALASPQAAGGKSAQGEQWTYTRRSFSPHSVFNHVPHVDRRDPSPSCDVCHRLDTGADYAAYFEDSEHGKYLSNFTPIAKDTCAQCHGGGPVQDDCRLCHDYHLKSSKTAATK
ncbi:MAG: cytochrome c3 family protein, partial [Burkholderiales bacterium]